MMAMFSDKSSKPTPVTPVSFVDGRVSYIKIYWQGAASSASPAADYDPPAGYDYQWSGG
jgi:hypothetical protein